MNKIKSNILIGYFGLLMSILGIMQGTNPVLLFYMNNFMFFAYLAILPFIFLYELNNKRNFLNTILLFILFLLYQYLYSKTMLFVAFVFIFILFIIYYMLRKRFNNVNFDKYTPFTFMLFNRYIGLTSLILLISYFVINYNI
jgi:hypothetical protein